MSFDTLLNLLYKHGPNHSLYCSSKKIVVVIIAIFFIKKLRIKEIKLNYYIKFSLLESTNFLQREKPD